MKNFEPEGEIFMQDLLFIGISIAFFAATVGLIQALRQL